MAQQPQLLSSSTIRREIFANSDITGVRKKIMNEMSEAQRGDYVKMGDALEQMVNTEGWVYAQEYMMKLIMGSVLNDENKDITKGFINLLHFIDQVIKAKNEIKAKVANEKV